MKVILGSLILDWSVFFFGLIKNKGINKMYYFLNFRFVIFLGFDLILIKVVLLVEVY